MKMIIMVREKEKWTYLSQLAFSLEIKKLELLLWNKT